MKTLGFVKMSGTGNDFVLVDNREGAIPEDAKAELARALCPRRTAIGADGLMLLEPSEVAGVRMRIFNADGSEPEMCGNGSRCLAHFARALGAAAAEMKIETLAGVAGGLQGGLQAPVDALQHAREDGPVQVGLAAKVVEERRLAETHGLGAV